MQAGTVAGQDTIQPADAREVAEVVAQAASAHQPLFIRGGGSKIPYGRPVEASKILDVSRLSGVIEYEPAELYVTARAATPLAEIASLLAAQNQVLAFEPPDWGRLLHAQGAPTLGGVVACNMAGPRRVRAGAARDHFLGFSAVDGRGDTWKAGGRVVKNVTGYDMCKLQAGAFGTLSVFLEVTLRALPRPETSCSIVFSGLGEAEAIRLLALALNSPHEVSAAAHLPPPAAARAGAAGPAGKGMTVLRLEGPRPSVAFRAGALLGLHASGIQLQPAESQALWAAIGSVQPLLAESASVVWRVCATPSAAPALLESVRRQVPGADGFYDWGGGLLWIEFLRGFPDDAGACVVRGALGTGGHATLFRAEPRLRSNIPVFQPQPAPLEALSHRVKSGFDPLKILNPGRMHQGF